MAVKEPEVRVERRPAPGTDVTWQEEPPVRELFRQLADDGTTLIRQEVALGKAELRETATALAKDAMKIGLAMAVGLMAGLAATAFLIIALGDLLNNYWLGALIVTVVLLVIAAILARQGMNDMQRRDLKPTRTLATLEDDAEWAKGEVADVKREWKS